MRSLIFFLAASSLFAQDKSVVILKNGGSGRSDAGRTPSFAPYINVVTSTVTPGSTINLSSAKQDWRDLTEPAGPLCQSYSECYADRKSGGTGIMGVHPLTTSQPNYYSISVPSIANLSHTGDGTVKVSGSSGVYHYFQDQGYEVRAFADNQVEKTLTLYVGMVDYYTGSPTTKTADLGATFTVSFTDTSVTPVTVSIASTAAANDGLKEIQIKYRSASDGQEIVVRGVRNTLPANNGLLVFAGVTLDSPATGSITRSIPANADLQAEANGMFRSGDVQLFPDGYIYGGALKIPPRDGITMRTSLNLASGIQVLPSQVKVKISPPYNVSACALTIPEGVSHFSIDGFEITQDSSASQPASSYGVICIQPNLIDYGSHQAVPYNVGIANLPSDISLTHIYTHGQPLTVGPTYSLEPSGSGRQLCGASAAFANVSSNGCFEYGIIADGNRVVIADSWITDFVGREADAVQVRLGQHVTITNNQISSNGENVMVFASPAYNSADSVYNPANASQVPPNGGIYANYTEISYNHIFKDPSYCLIPFTKNLIETKNGKNTHIHHNLMELSCEGVYSQGQHGNGIAIANRTRNGYNNGLSSGSGDQIAATPWASTQHIEVDHNTMRSVNRGFGIQGPYDDYYCADLGNAAVTQAQFVAQAVAEGVTGRGLDWSIHDNYVADISPSKYGTYSTQPAYASGSTTSEAAGIFGTGGDDLHVFNNTFSFAQAAVGSIVPSFTRFGITSPDHIVGLGENSGWDLAKITRENFLYPRSVCSGELMQKATGLQFYNNIMGAELNGNSIGGIEILDADPSFGGWANFTFKNNNVQNAYLDGSAVVSPSVAWVNSLSAAIAAAPTQYTGNTINTAAPAGAGAPLSALLAGECAIRYGNRPELVAACTTPTQ